MYMAYSQSNGRTTLQGTAQASKGMTTKRGHAKLLLRFLLIAVILGTVFSFGAIVQAYAGDSAVTASTPIASIQPSAQPIQHEKIVIQSGDTLWDIADSHKNKGENTRSYVERLKSFNHLSSSSLQAGQVLLLP
ncbi:LysM peptidoglycan-binding domain-containing protein [Paenibacillus qinlingensis]|uniref:LysM repeat protein n=1 Tax=Paenibacillus qinlingensis TaxID=1837343 RepID=A0ABU1NQA9_9BACL|nr:LysM peptidoglycan-binding domain-containing protein [Paenibacillus qinlingensis]MDR6549655.1 LysM repeat protein [Paenibacillus qinlingensis]